MNDAQTIELMAPAKNYTCGIAAINCGADAVYIGAPKFSARIAAGNSIDDIARLVDYAHFFNVKIHIAINTLLKDDELHAAEKMIKGIYRIGADGIIIQDMGILELDIPPIPIIASTQCHNATPEKVLFLEKIGFQRAILARELSLVEIKKIRTSTAIELETFIHGALCVSYSGQCYLSYALGGRSGNRGECAQPCRNKYSLLKPSGEIIIKDKHLLSLRDLNLSQHIEALMRAGISSFKIEGRLKDECYVKNIVTFYRALLDDLMRGTDYKRSSSGKSSTEFIPNPAKTFNRRYTNYFIDGRKKGSSSWETPKFVGEKIGNVAITDEHYFILEKNDSGIKLHPGDGISFFDEEKILQGTNLNRVEVKKIYPAEMNGITKGTFIYRNHDHNYNRILKNSRDSRKIRVDMRLFEKDGSIHLSLCDEDGITATVSRIYLAEPAKDPVKAKKTIHTQLEKLGDTQLYCGNISIECEDAYFFPISLLNELRREAAATITSLRKNGYIRTSLALVKNSYPYPEKTSDYHSNILNEKAAVFYRSHGAEIKERSPESGISMKGKKVMTTKYCILFELGKCGKGAAADSRKKTLLLADQKGNRLELRFNCKRCVMEMWMPAD